MKDFQDGDTVVHDKIGVGKIYRNPNTLTPTIIYELRCGNILTEIHTFDMTGWLLQDTSKQDETVKTEATATATVETIDGIQYITVSVPCPDCPKPVERVLKMYPTSFNGGWDMSLESKKVDPTTGDRHHTCERPVFEEPESNGSLVTIRDEFGKKRRLVKRSNDAYAGWIDIDEPRFYSWKDIKQRVISLDWK